MCLVWLRAPHVAAGAGIALYGSHKGLGPRNLAAGNSYQPHITSYDYDCMVSEAGDYGQPGIGGPNKYEASLCMHSCGCPGIAQMLLNAKWLPVHLEPIMDCVWRPQQQQPLSLPTCRCQISLHKLMTVCRAEVPVCSKQR